MTPIGLYRHELKALRQELFNLKNCQVNFLTFSITATGVLLGLGSSIAESLGLEVISLFPLTVLLPSWWIFIDKATTINRIVGYYRILEGLILGRYKAPKFLGWENALSEFRRCQDERKLQPPEEWQSKFAVSRLINMFLQPTYRYLVISHFTFLTLSFLCAAISIRGLSKAPLFGTTLFYTVLGATVLCLISAACNMHRIWQLIYGRHSYGCNEHFWKQILEVKAIPSD